MRCYTFFSCFTVSDFVLIQLNYGNKENILSYAWLLFAGRGVLGEGPWQAWLAGDGAQSPVRMGPLPGWAGREDAGPRASASSWRPEDAPCRQPR